MIIRNSGVSLRSQIKDSLKNELQKIGYGEKFPPEQDLAVRFGVSRGTIRQAISELVNEGLLYRIQGKGTFKGGIAVSHSRHVLHSMTEQLMQEGLHPGICDIELSITEADDKIARYLNIYPGSLVWKLSRTRLANNQPIAICNAFIRRDVIPDLKKEDLKMSLMEMLKSKYSIELCESETYCTAELAGDMAREKLQCGENTPVMRIEFIGLLKDKLPFMLDISEALGNKYLLRIEQTNI